MDITMSKTILGISIRLIASYTVTLNMFNSPVIRDTHKPTMIVTSNPITE